MREFFRGWRRKAGLVTLALACVLTVGWMRSFATADLVITKRGSYFYLVRSLLGEISFDRLSIAAHESHRDVPPTWKSTSADGFHRWPRRDADIVRRWKWLGFDFAEEKIHDTVRYRGIIPYWSLVLPLTLLSAWLLLIKPRPAKSAKESSRA